MPLEGEVRLIPLLGIPEIRAGVDVVEELVAAAARIGGFRDEDTVVVAHKIISKAEGATVRLDEVKPSDTAREIAATERDPRVAEVILRETVEIVRRRGSFLVCETRHGFVCASAGVDASNAPRTGELVLLPRDADRSARIIRDRIRAACGAHVAIVISDSFGRAWRRGSVDVAVGVAGMTPLLDLAGERDRTGYRLRATKIAVADEVASAAELVLGKTRGIPAAIVRGVQVSGKGEARELIIPRERDLFR